MRNGRLKAALSWDPSRKLSIKTSRLTTRHLMSPHASKPPLQSMVETTCPNHSIWTCTSIRSGKRLKNLSGPTSEAWTSSQERTLCTWTSSIRVRESQSPIKAQLAANPPGSSYRMLTSPVMIHTRWVSQRQLAAKSSENEFLRKK